MIPRAFFAVLLLLGCSELKKQARLGLTGTGSAYVPAHQPDGARSPTAAAGSALQGVGAAVGAAVASRALGGCVATCPPGTACNTATGFCESQPCRGLCAADEVCQNERCVPVLLPGLIIEQKH